MSTNSSPVFLITGCSSGFGRDLVKAALDKGFRVIATARKVEMLAALGSLGAKTLALDVTSTPATLQQFATSAIAIYGQVDYLVNNAGFLQGGAIEEVSPTQAFAQFNTNIFGLVNTTDTFLPHFRARRTGTIVNISSVGPLMGMPGVGWYAASKGALDVLSDTWANELAEYGIRSISVQPGAFRTDVFQSSNVRFSETTIEGYKAAHRVVESIPAWKQPGDAAKASRNIITLVTKPGSDLPLRFVIGDEALPNAEKFYMARLAELEVVRELGTGTSFPA
ncbi:putative short-chain oxidoreductase [Mycena vitilis]|nr:putative short-chain oxidoreductase [Mycena vitilis]